MVDIPEHLLLRSAEARAKALGITVEQALAEMKGESSPTVVDDEPEVIEVELLIALGYLKNQGMLQQTDQVTSIEVEEDLNVVVVRTKRRALLLLRL